MKRFTGVRVLTQALLDCDVGIFIGDGVCREAAPYLGGGSYLFFPDTEDFILSVAVGMAIGTDKRVFVFCEDNYILRNMTEVLQAGIAKARNFFLVMFSSGEYPEVPNTPNILASANSQHGMFYEMGFIVHNYTNQFKSSKNPINFIRETWDRVRGPIAVLMKTTKGTKSFPDINFSGPAEINKTREFILDESIIGHNFVPPISLDQLGIGE
jgi:hypothetical protein